MGAAEMPQPDFPQLVVVGRLSLDVDSTTTLAGCAAVAAVSEVAVRAAATSVRAEVWS